MGQIDEPEASLAQDAVDPVAANLRWGRNLCEVVCMGLELLSAGVSLRPFDLDKGGKHLPDLVGHFREAIDVLLDARPLSQAIPLRELLGEFVESTIVERAGCRGNSPR
jgi:hypothetical protein